LSRNTGKGYKKVEEKTNAKVKVEGKEQVEVRTRTKVKVEKGKR
jgi:hypothetical protein